MSTRTYPRSAFQFLAPASIAPVADVTTPAARRFRGIAYSGEPITDHGYWGNPIAFDLATLQLETPAPLLSQHDYEDTIGVIDESTIGQSLEIGGKLFSHIDERAAGIAAKADEGFPWQMSVGIYPGSIEEVQAGTSLPLNGRSMTGPITIFRNARVREVSFCALGADARTKAQVFDQGATITIETIEEKPMTDKTDTPDPRIAELEAELTAKNEQLVAATARAETAETALKTFKAEQRKSQIATMFATLGREFTDEAAAHYLALSDVQFAAVSADLIAAHRPLPDYLFSNQVTEGGKKQPSLAELNAAMLADYGKRSAA